MKRRSPQGAIAVAWALMVSAQAAWSGPTQGRAWHHPLTERYGIEHGLPSGEVVAIREDSEGYVWAATIAGGLCRFDGERFQVFGPEAGLPTNRVKNLRLDRKGRLVVATAQGLFVFEHGHFVRESRWAFADERAVNDVVEASDGSVWVATTSGLFVLSANGQLRRFGQADGLPTDEITALAEDEQGSMWVGLTQGMARVSAGQLRFWKPGRDGPADGFVTRIVAGRDGGVWFATDHGLQRFRNEAFSIVALSLHASPVYVLDVAETGDGLLFVATANQGLLCIPDGASAFAPDLGEQLTLRSAWSLLLDSFGGVWVGTGDMGALRLSVGPFERVVTGPRLEHAVANDLAWGDDGALWVASLTHGAMKLSPSCIMAAATGCTVQRVTSAEGLLSDAVRSVAPIGDHSGQAWLGTQWGPFLTDGHRARRVEAFAQPYPTRGLVLPSSHELIIANKEEGLVSFRQQPSAADWVRSPTSSREPSLQAQPESLWSLTRSEAGTLWLGATQKLFSLDHDVLKTVPLPMLPRDDRVTEVRVEAEGRVWFRSDTAVGVWVDGTVLAVAIPQAGWLLPIEPGSVLVHSDESIERLHLDWAEKRLSIAERVPLPSGSWPGPITAAGAVLAPDGTVLFGSTEGIYRYDPSRVTPTPSPRLHLLSLGHQRDSRVGAESEALSLSAEENFLDVRVDAVAFPSPESIQFRYRLDGLSADWSAQTRSRTILYSNLAPGEYRLRVQAKYGEAWSPELHSPPIRVRPAYWQTPWFRLAVLLLAATIAASVPTWRARQLRIRRDLLEHQVAARTHELAYYAKTLEQLVTERTKQLQEATDYQVELLETERRAIARDLHDDAGQLLTALQLELFLLKEHSPGAAGAQTSVEQLQKRADELNESFRRTLLRLRPQLLDDRGLPTALSWLCDSLETSSGVPIERQIDEAARLEPDASMLVYRIAQGALSNAVAHSKATRISLLLQEAGDVVTLQVCDDGTGFDVEQQKRGTRLGLSGMIERARAGGASLELSSAPGAGARVTLRVMKTRQPSSMPS